MRLFMRKKTLKDFIKQAKEIHGDKYDYSKSVYLGANEKIEIICPKHGSFWQFASNHLQGAGCLLCNKVDKRRKSFNELMKDAYKIHGDKYDYSKVDYVNNKSKVIIICPQHGEFKQSMYKHINSKQGCPKCAMNHKDDRYSFIEKARKIYGDIYDYSKVNYIDSYTKVEIIDKKYGSFWITPNSHLNGRGSWLGRKDKINETKRKNHTFNTSKTERIVKNKLMDYFGEDDVVHQYSSDDYPFNCDFYIKSLDLYIEINVYFSHGGHFYDENNEDDMKKALLWANKSKSSDLYKKALEVWTVTDVLKRKTALEKNLNYLAFWRYDLKDFNEWLSTFKESPVFCNIK